MTQSIKPLVVLFVVLCFPGVLPGQINVDLKSGVEALQAGDLEPARKLLEAAAQDLPASVEAQMALAECYLKLGLLNDAMRQYRKVLALSPDHVQAKSIVEALAGRTADYEQRLASANALMQVGAFSEAATFLKSIVRDVTSPEERAIARLMELESLLWSGNQSDVLTGAMHLAETSKDAAISGPARIIASLALLRMSEQNPRSLVKAEEMLQQAGAVEEPWASRGKLVSAFAKIVQPDSAVEASLGLHESFADIPGTVFRSWAQNYSANNLLQKASESMGQGSTQRALEIVWPMIGSGPTPEAATDLKPVTMQGGWLDDRLANTKLRTRITRILVYLGQSEIRRSGSNATLFGYWLAAEYNRQAGSLLEGTDALLELARSLANAGRPTTTRASGDAPHFFDRMQKQVLLNVAKRVTNENQKGPLVDLILGQIQRYRSASDLATGLAQFTSISADAQAEGDGAGLEAVPVQLPKELAGLGPGAAHQKLMLALANGYLELGQKDFEESATTLNQNANAKINLNDRVALTLIGQVQTMYFNKAVAEPLVDNVVTRYSAMGNWTAALAAVDIVHAGATEDTGRWSAIQLKLRQAEKSEDQRLATHRKLGDDLPDLIREVIEEVVKIVESDTRQVTRNKAMAIAASLVNRYSSLQRIDLAEAVLEAITQADQLADRILWSRINLLERQAAHSLSSTVHQLAKDEELQVDPFHKQALELIDRLLAEFEASNYRQSAVQRVQEISGIYQQHDAHAVATDILREFLQANPELNITRQIEFRIIQIAMHKAQNEFSRSTENEPVPTALSAEYTECIDLLTGFLAAHPVGDFSVEAENQLFNIVVAYGNAGAWDVAREVIERFAAAIPDFRSPQHLNLLRAATWLGELDRQYAAGLLSPLPQTDPAPASFSGPIDGLADLDRSDSEEAEADIAVAGRASGGGRGGFGDDAFAEAAKERDIALLMEPSFEVYHAEVRSQPSETALAMIRQSQQRQFQQLAMLEGNQSDNQPGQNQSGQQAGAAQQTRTISLPTGSVLSEAEMKRQNEAADQAYAILLDIIRTTSPSESAIKSSARAHVMWLFGFFEGQMRSDQAIVLIHRYLTDQPNDPDRVALAFQAINDQLTWAAQRQPNERVNLAWLDERHEWFQAARKSIQDFATEFSEETEWVNRALLLTASSYQREAEMTAAISNVRAGGLLVRSADALIRLLQTRPEHPQCGGLAQQIWNISDRLQGLAQRDAANYVLSQIPIHFPTNPLARQSVLRIAELHAVNLSQPLRAVETYQEFLSLNGDNEQVRSQIFEIARQLAQRQRYLESLHVYGVFVDSFPDDGRAAEALQAMGRTHQTNEAWTEAIEAYQRVLSEYASATVIPQVKLAMAECQINLSHWREARKLYEEFIRQYPEDGQSAIARGRLDWLKKLDRYETLLADQEVMRHKDDAQFEIGRIVLTQFGNPVKAIQEFEKVVAQHAQSDVADDAQLEIGKAYLALGRMADAREALLKVPVAYPTSPLADDALYLLAQSYEQQATRLASVTLRGARELAYDARQKGAYQDFNEAAGKIRKLQAEKRHRLKSEGKDMELALDEASQSFRQNSLALSGLSNTARRAEQQAETESALQVANRQDRINEANREAIRIYMQAATDYPLGDKTDDSLLRIAQIFETQLKDRTAAMETYQKIVKLFPGTPVAEDAAWNVALFHEQEGEYELAATALRDFIRSYPASNRVADAQYSLAEVLEELGQWINAMDEYETFRQKFSDHPRAVVALEQINWIRTYRK